MSPRRTRRGTVLENSSAIDTSVDTSIRSTKKAVRSTRRTRKDINVNSADEENVSPIKVNNSTRDTGTSLANDRTISKRKRRRNIQDSVLSQDISLSVTVDESPTKKSNLKTPKTKNQNKSNKRTKSKKTENNSLISEDESFNTKSQKETKRVSYSMDNLISEDEDAVSPSKKKKPSNRKSKTPDKISISRKAATVINSAVGNITPQKNSPINVSFTPHRSTKTPKRSPINLGSPKTLPRSSLKLLNVQRRLSITVSPPSSEKSANTVKPQEYVSSANESVENTSITDITSKSTKGKSNSPTLKVRSKFSKSLKIDKKVPKPKSKKSPIKDSPKISEKSPVKFEKSQAKSVKSPAKSEKSPAKSKKSSAKSVESPNKSIKSPEKSIKSPANIKSSEKLLKDSVKSPMIIIESIKKLTTDSSSKAEKIPKDGSLSSTNLVESKSPDKSAKTSKSKSLHKLQKSSEKLSKSLKVTSSVKSHKSFLSTSLNSRKSLLSTSFKSKKSPFLNLSSKKMPKIFLNLKSKKSPFKLNKSTSSSKAKKSPTKTPKTATLTKTKNSPKIVSPTNKSSAHLTVSKSTSLDKSLSPRVILSKLTPHSSTPAIKIKSSTLNSPGKQPSLKLTPINLENQSSIKSGKSPKSPKVLAKRSNIKSPSPSKSLSNSMSASKKINETKTPSILLERKFWNMGPKNTSTPREKNIKRPITLASDKKIKSPMQGKNSVVFNGSPNSKSKVIKRLNNSLNKVDNPMLEDESQPFLDDTSLIRMSDVFDCDNSKNDSIFPTDKSNAVSSYKKKSVNSPNELQKCNKDNTFEAKKNNSSVLIKEKTRKNNTYELEHPKTPALQKRAEKRTVDEAKSGVTEDVKKTCKVTFATPQSKSQTGSSGISRMGTPGHPIQQRNSVASVSKTKTPLNRIESKSRLSSAMKPQSKKAVNSPKSRRQSQIDSVNRLSRPKGITDSGFKAAKTPVAKKIPNFAEIHQKNFAKMESLVDARKRVEKRHEVLNTPSNIKGQKPLPSDATNSGYNRFGYKLRKNDAVNIINKKQAGGVDSIEKKRENARSTLKGVRMNRRFELQMKSRMKNV